ncbi:MAG TPA: diadenylate cyclase CdaA [Caproiciproducens sp.]|nr:diadenylate cyclase CdaA [Caproiciproducens sp.]
MDYIITAWNSFISLLKMFRVSDALDVILVSFIIYSAIKLIRETRAEQLVKGIIILLLVWGASNLLKLYMMKTLLTYFFQFSVMALLIVFQPEIRRALEQIGRSGIGNKHWTFGVPSTDMEALLQQIRRGVNAVVDAAAVLQKQKTGALIVFERKTKLGDIIDTGTVVNAIPSAPIICNVFFNKAPLHDGAMIMRDGMLYAAGCILPLTKSDKVSIELGTRHRAAIGMSENSDAVVVVVSEETGQISVAINGVLTRNYTRETLKSELEGLILPNLQEQNEKRPSRIPSIWRGKKQ